MPFLFVDTFLRLESYILELNSYKDLSCKNSGWTDFWELVKGCVVFSYCMILFT